MLKLVNISFSYQEKTTLKDISFTIEKGKTAAIIGESGCGKSTLLKLIYGIYDLNNGQISYNDKPILGPKFNLIPGEEYIKYLAQDFDLMPFISVEENIGKFLSNTNKILKTTRINELLEMVEMISFAKTKVQYLSGGQQQRVAIAKVLALEPEILLLDEPFSQIDTFRKNKLRRNLFQYLKQKQITCLIATHDSKDILAFADETLVLQDGKLIANDNTKKLYENPTSHYIASLFDEVNEISSTIFNPENTNSSTILVYPHQLKKVEKSNMRVKVLNSYFKGNNFLIETQFNKQTIFFDSDVAIEKGTFVFLSIK